VAESAREQHFPERDFQAAESVDPEKGVSLPCVLKTISQLYDLRISSGVTQVFVSCIEHRSQSTDLRDELLHKRWQSSVLPANRFEIPPCSKRSANLSPRFVMKRATRKHVAQVPLEIGSRSF